MSEWKELLALWTIYKGPADYPDKYVVRRFTIDEKGAVPDAAPAYVGESLHEARNAVPRGSEKLCASPDDAACILESWI